ncbi:nSTAND1 domain-containing NTPase [Streptomyces albogriseolus]|uniref:nSTAND1 domain-containing NTPase n=1 Tax=Streptomyces albogriseolus TaxID=1887 RepID=UPI0033B8D137
MHRPGVHPGQELRQLRRRRGVSLAELARRIHYTKGYLSRVESGDKPLTPAVAEACDAALDTGGLLGRLLVTALPAQRRQGPDGGACPYRGLASYGTDDAGWFFGRERATAALVQVVTARLGAGPAMVVAASGTGKSSLLRAGLVPALFRGALPVGGSHRWPVLTLRPGDRPVDALTALLARTLGTEAEPLRDVLDGPDGPRALARRVRELLAEGGAGDAEDPRLALVVDQFEEVFTLCEDPAERTRFVRVLHTLSASPGGAGPEGRTRPTAALVVLGMRADFYGAALAHPELAEALREGQLPLEPMTPDEIRAAVTRPAEAAGLELEPGLVEVVLRDLGAAACAERSGTTGGAAGGEHGPGVLPLLSHALLTTWQEREGTRLTLEGYERAGGIVQAVAASAEAAYGRLAADREGAARAVLLSLVRVDEDGRATRRHADRGELASCVGGEAGEVVEEFTRSRLLTVDRDSVTLAHEVVLRAWPRLRNWIDTDAEALRARHRLREAARTWEAAGRDPGLLPRGSSLAAAQDAAPTAVDDTERAFLRAAQAREDEEQRRERRRTRRLRRLVAALAALLVVALASTVTAVHNSRKAADGERRARLNEKLALLGVPSIAGDSRSALLLAASAWADDHTDASASALLSAQAHPYAGALKGHVGPVRTVTWTADGRHVVSGGGDGTVRVWDARTRRQVREYADGAAVRAVTVVRRTGTVVWGNERGELTRADGAHAPVPLAGRHMRRVNSLAASEDGRVLLSVSDDGVVHRFDTQARDAGPVRSVPLGRRLYSAAVTGDGRRAAVAGEKGGLWLFDPEDGGTDELPNDKEEALWALAFTPDGRRLVAGEWDGEVTVWDTGTRRKVAVLEGLADSVVDVSVSADGRYVAAASQDDVAAVWDLATGRRLTTLTAHRGFVWGVEYAPDGRTVATAGEDGTVRLWTPAATLGLVHRGEPWRGGALSPDGRLLAVAGDGGTARLVDLRTGDARRLSRTLGGRTPMRAVAFSSDGALVAASDDRGHVGVWRTADPRRPVAEWSAHTRAVKSLAFRPGERVLLVTGSEDRTARLWRLPEHGHRHRPVRVREFAGHIDGVHTVVFLDRDTLVTGGLDSQAVVWEQSSGRLLRRLPHRHQVLGLAVAPDGTLATTGWDRTVRLWSRPADGRRARLLTGHTGGVLTAAFNRSGTRLVTAGQDRTVRVWDTADGRLLLTLGGHEGPVRGVAFLGDDGPVVSVAEDSTIRRWSLDTGAVLRQVCGVVGDTDRATWERALPGIPYEPGCP